MIRTLFGRRKDGSTPRRKTLTWSRVLMALAVAVTIYVGVSSLFAFRGVTYLSDATFLISMFPIAAIVVGLLVLGGNVLLLRKRRTRTRIAMTVLSALAVVSLVVNSAVFAVTSDERPRPAVAADNAAIEKRLAQYGDVFTAGAAKGDITPTSNLMPMPLLFVLKFDKVVHNVHARALAMSDGEQQSLFITLDMTLVPRADETLSFLSEQTGIPKQNIFIAATHTHGVTPISLFEPANPVDRMKIDEWYSQIQETLLSTVQKARQNMVPARYGHGTGQSNVNVNRDVVIDGGTSVLGSNFERPSDKTLRLARFETLDGTPIALIVNHATHGVVINGLLNGIRTPLSGDLPGQTSAKLEEQLGGVVLWTSGAAGDQNPRITTQFAPSGKPVSDNLGDAGLLVLDSLADEHARDIVAADKTITANRSEARLFASEVRTSVPSKDEEGATVPYTLRLFMVGDLVYQGISAEIVTSIGKQIVDASPRENTTLITLANGYAGYVADDWHYEHDAFEVGPTVQGEAQKQFLKGFDELYKGAPTAQWMVRK